MSIRLYPATIMLMVAYLPFLLLPGCSSEDAVAPIQASSEPGDSDSANTRFDWPAIGLAHNEQRYVPLETVNRDNLDRIGLISSFDLSRYAHIVTAPIAVNGVVYFSSGLSVLHAVEAATGKLLWTYDPEVIKHAGEKMRIGWGSRGITFSDGLIYWGTGDGRLLAVKAGSGELVWSVMTVEPDDRRYVSGPPRVFNGKVIIGHGGADVGAVRGYVTTYDAKTGEQLWRFYTVPGNPADGFEDKAQAMAAKTWKGDWWELGGGGTVWNAMTYDPDLNRIYLGTGNGAPWNRKIRSPGGGDNLFLCSIVALDADTGEYIWHYQVNPGETWDYNAAMEMILADLEIDGQSRKVLMQAPKNGFFYVLDRQTGELISAEAHAKVTWAEGIDEQTGRPIEVPGTRYENGEVLMWPGPIGAHNWLPMAFSPRTGLVYMPAIELPGYYNDTAIDVATWRQSEHVQLNSGVDSLDAEPSPDFGSSSLVAWDPVSQKAAWREPTPFVVNGGTFVTSNNLVFQGQADGQFVARDAESGKLLWSYDTGGALISPPITFAHDGRQYFALISGQTGAMAMANAGHTDWTAREQPKRLLILTLDGQATLPEAEQGEGPTLIAAPDFELDDAKVAAGKKLFGYKCTHCHGPAAISGGAAPDLRASSVVQSDSGFRSIVVDGALLQRGMPVFDELDDDDLDAIRHYVRFQARKAIRNDTKTAGAIREP